MKGFSAAATAVVGAALFLKTAVAAVDPIVIKVCQLRQPLRFQEICGSDTLPSTGLEVLLRDQRNSIVRMPVTQFF